MQYLFQGELDNTIHEITCNQIKELYVDNKLEEEEGKRITESSYRGANFYDGKNDQMAFSINICTEIQRPLDIEHTILMV